MDIKFLTQENEIQKLYSKFGLVVPVGDLETGKAPAIQPLPAQATQTSVTFSFNVMSGADITAIEYKVNDGEAVSVTPQKGVVTVELSDLEYNSGPYEIELTVTNETGDTSVTQTADLVPYTDWANANEVLEGNKFIGEDGQEAVGTYVAPEPVLSTLNATENGTYTPEEGVDGYSEVTVNVPTGPSNYLELQYLETAWEDRYQQKSQFGGIVILNINNLNIPEGGTYSGNTPQDWVADMEYIRCYLDSQHSDSFEASISPGIGVEPRPLGVPFITSDGTIILPCTSGYYEPDPDTGEQTIPNYGNIPCDQTDLTGDFEVYAVTGVEEMWPPIYEVVATGTYFIPATQPCR